MTEIITHSLQQSLVTRTLRQRRLERALRQQVVTHELGSFYLPPTSPADLAGLVSWHSLSDVAGSLTPGQQVDTFPDVYGGYDATAAVGSQEPLYEEGPPPGLNFDGADDHMAVAAKSSHNFLHQGAASLIVRFQMDDIDSGDLQTLCGSQTLSSIYTGISFGIDDRSSQGGENRLRLALNRGVAGQSVYDFNRSADSLDTAGLTSGVHTVGAVWDASSAQLFFDGAALGAAVAAAYALPTGDSHTPFDLGRSGSTGNFDGTIFDVLTYSRRLTAAEMAIAMGGL